MQSCATETDLQWHWEKRLPVKTMRRQHKHMSRRLCQSPAIPIILSNHPSEWSMEQKDLHNTVQKKGENSMFILRYLASKSEPRFKYRHTTGVRNEENHDTKVWCMNWILTPAQKILGGKQKFAIILSSTISRASHQVHANWQKEEIKFHAIPKHPSWPSWYSRVPLPLGFFCNPWLLQDNNVPADDIPQHLDMNVEAFMQQETNSRWWWCSNGAKHLQEGLACSEVCSPSIFFVTKVVMIPKVVVVYARKGISSATVVSFFIRSPSSRDTAKGLDR